MPKKGYISVCHNSSVTLKSIPNKVFTRFILGSPCTRDSEKKKQDTEQGEVAKINFLLL